MINLADGISTICEVFYVKIKKMRNLNRNMRKNLGYGLENYKNDRSYIKQYKNKSGIWFLDTREQSHIIHRRLYQVGLLLMVLRMIIES